MLARLWSLDQTIFREIHIDAHRAWLDPIFLAISTTGLGGVQVALALLLPLVFSYRLRQDPNLTRREAIWTVLKGSVQTWRDPIYLVGPMIFVIATSGLIFSGLTKELLDRERPSNYAFAVPQEQIYFGSYPSGHTTTSFAIAFMALFVTWGTPHAKWGRWALVWASLVGLSRIYRGVHWPSDVLGGVFAGLLSACLALLGMRWLARRAQPPESTPIV